MNTKSYNSDISNGIPARSGRKKSLKDTIEAKTFLILKKDPDSRTAQENQHLIQVLESIDFFSEEILTTLRQNQSMEDLLRSLKLESFEKNHAIYHIGAPTEFFYVILEGNVKLYKPRPQDQIDQETSLIQNSNSSSVVSTPRNSLAQSPLSRLISHISSSPKRIPFEKLDFTGMMESISVPSPQQISMNRSRLGATRHKTMNLSTFRPRDDSNDNEKINSPKNEITASFAKSHRKQFAPNLSLTTQLPITPPHLSNISLHINLENPKPSNPKINRSICEEDQYILSQITEPNHKYVLNNGVCKFSVHRELKSGDTFGGCTKKGFACVETAVSTTKVYVLSISIDKYLEIFHEPINERKDRKQVFQRLFSGCQNEYHIFRFAELFSRRKYAFKDVIYSQGSLPKGLYMVRKGEVKITYTESHKIAPSARKLEKTGIRKIEVAKLAPYQFFGAEELLGRETRMFTAEAFSMELELLYLDSLLIREPALNTTEFLAMIKSMCQRRYEWEARQLVNIKQRIVVRPHNSDEKKVFFVIKESSRMTMEHRLSPIDNSTKDYDPCSNPSQTRRISSPGPLPNKERKEGGPSEPNSAVRQFYKPLYSPKENSKKHHSNVDESHKYHASKSIIEFPKSPTGGSRDFSSFTFIDDQRDKSSSKQNISRGQKNSTNLHRKQMSISVGTKLSIFRQSVNQFYPKSGVLKQKTSTRVSTQSQATGNTTMTSFLSQNQSNSFTGLMSAKSFRYDLDSPQLDCVDEGNSKECVPTSQSPTNTSPDQFIKRKLKTILSSSRVSIQKKPITNVFETDRIGIAIKEYRCQEPRKIIK